MYANTVNAPDLKPSSLKFINKESKGSAGIRDEEDVFVHKRAPDEIVVFPGFAEIRSITIVHTRYGSKGIISELTVGVQDHQLGQEACQVWNDVDRGSSGCLSAARLLANSDWENSSAGS
ncbi:predicted protein [Aspergillus nidulans FGSC A4]|uniref:Uncharacterized protein n=1 Tax=Emericella nidulans (strain FGSC A4 / ATCC 38163 / CBS 112.46 / NRRL 194 / M139) TaxID=227321 RepID=Q5B885_EMENI|nr:hypothetical protein [Aspergillus nidulans FGSC A4]EAA63146.1 predicted protein [Aspergillus nidulans FGSC A4]CBF83108.1 TPA: conserved hypothetical protein [Aspergillus nidulans FGSC A4]|eukprot:XP_660849.1 predicted protein [Aspergillus nidulans FGSC A4]